MSVKSKMTAIADKIRALLGLSDTMGLDAMATNLETVQDEVEIQDELISRIAGVLAGKAGGGNGIVPSGTKTITENGTHDVTQYASAEANVSTDGVIVQRVSGSCVSPAVFQSTTVDVGFKPDIVTFPDYGVITGNTIENTTSSATAFFAESNNYNKWMQTHGSESGVVYQITVKQGENGFTLSGVDDYATGTRVDGKTINYVAIKYTQEE